MVSTENQWIFEIRDCVNHNYVTESGSSVGSAFAWYADGRGFDPHVRQHSFVECGHEIISTAIIFLPLIQEGQLSVIGERMCIKYWKAA